ncbi:MAG: hypothetical protein KC503_34900 [Myxococcales bacterium]|nr:hypothetical protein [Myxococcales bacterium]
MTARHRGGVVVASRPATSRVRPRLTLMLMLVPALVVLWGACGSRPPRPYGQPNYRLSDVPRYRAPARAKLRSGKRLLVIGALDDLTVQPTGGQYHDHDYDVAPLVRTYTYWALPSKLADELHAALRRRGLRVVKSYRDLGAPVPFAAPTFPSDLVVLRGEIRAFTYSRHDGDGGVDVLVARLDLRLLENGRGAVLWRGHVEEKLRTPMTDLRGPDAFALLGERLAAALLADKGFVRAIGARP